MATAPKKNSAVIVKRSRKTFAMPPATMGFASLIDPDTYDPDKPMFKVNLHYTPAGIEAVKQFLQEHCIDALFPDLQKDALEAKLPCVADISGCQSPEDFMEGKLKEPKEQSKIQLPFMQIGVKQMFKNKSQEQEARTIAFWDAKNNLLDGKAMKIGMGSIIQPIVYPNLYLSKQNGKDPRPSLQLVGIRVLKLESWGKGAAKPDAADDEAIREVMGADFDMDDDLSAFAAGSAKAAPAADEHDEDLPF